MSGETAPVLSIVVIGRNEGAGIGRAVRSAHRALRRSMISGEVLYIDSASTDDSVDFALEAGAEVHVLPPERSGAATARNEGLRRARGNWVHFLDGDMQLIPGWLPQALQRACGEELDGLAGWIRETLDRATIWSRAFGFDWSADGAKCGPIGGAGLWRRTSLSCVGGFDESLQVGEDPDLCRRMEQAGFRLEATAVPMVSHELGLHGPLDWWRRAVSVGRSAAFIAAEHGDRRLAWQRFGQPAAVLWMALAVMWLPPPSGWIFLGALVALILRRAWLDKRAGLTVGDALLHGAHVYTVKIPQLLGAMQVALGGHRLRKTR